MVPRLAESFEDLLLWDEQYMVGSAEDDDGDEEEPTYRYVPSFSCVWLSMLTTQIN